MTGLLEQQWPFFGLVDDIRPALGIALEEGPCVVATITALEGGGPRPVGAQMLFCASGMVGFLSGGCIEADVATHAWDCLQDGRPRRLVYGQGSPWPDIRLLCGARIEVLLERIARHDPAAKTLVAYAQARQPCVWSSDGQQRRCHAVDAESGELDQDRLFVRRYDPVTRLIVVGGDPTALALASLGSQAGFDVTLVRPKGPEAKPIPGIAYRRERAALALAELAPDPWTAVAVCTHDFDLDHEALAAVLDASAFYVGVLGARRRLAQRQSALRTAGVSREGLARLRAPIGLDLGGKAPMEIAVAVIAEIIADRHRAASPELSREVSWSLGRPPAIGAVNGR